MPLRYRGGFAPVEEEVSWDEAKSILIKLEPEKKYCCVVVATLWFYMIISVIFTFSGLVTATFIFFVDAQELSLELSGACALLGLLAILVSCFRYHSRCALHKECGCGIEEPMRYF